MTYKEIQDDVIRKYDIQIDAHSSCRGRMHAHVKERKICKWVSRNSLACTFDLLHEIGHIETTKTATRRAEAEYFATIWAIDRLREYGFETPQSILFKYQRYILLEIRRGERRGGRKYGDLNLYRHVGLDVTLDDVYEACDRNWKRFIDGYE